MAAAPTKSLATAKALPVVKTASYNNIISSQNFSGFWSLAELPLLESFIGKVKDEDKSDEMVTLLFLEILRVKFTGLKKEWRLIETKSLKWLKKNHKESLDELKQKVKAYNII